MSNKSWIHPEYKPLLEANVAGSIRVSHALAQLNEENEHSPVQQSARHCSGSRLIVSFLMMACCISLLIAEFLLSAPQGLSLASISLPAEADGMLPFRNTGVVDKATFLAKVSANRLTKLANNTHYILTLMTSTG